MVKDLGKESQWVSIEPLAVKCMGTRIQFITDPQLKVWVEALDPIHRHVWREVVFNEKENFFLNYDLEEEIPCPHTRLLSVNTPGMKTRRMDKYKGDLFIPETERNRDGRRSSEAVIDQGDPHTKGPQEEALSPPPQPQPSEADETVNLEISTNEEQTQ